MKNDYYELLHRLNTETYFSITFTKNNGEERTYNKCRMHVKSEFAVGTGITAKQHHDNYGNVMFWVEDEGKNLPGYRIAKIDNIKEVKIVD